MIGGYLRKSSIALSIDQSILVHSADSHARKRKEGADKRTPDCQAKFEHKKAGGAAGFVDQALCFNQTFGVLRETLIRRQQTKFELLLVHHQYDHGEQEEETAEHNAH